MRRGMALDKTWSLDFEVWGWARSSPQVNTICFHSPNSTGQIGLICLFLIFFVVASLGGGVGIVHGGIPEVKIIYFHSLWFNLVHCVESVQLRPVFGGKRRRQKSGFGVSQLVGQSRIQKSVSAFHSVLAQRPSGLAECNRAVY